ncbi:uncharacterized protein LOC117601744 isoform X1 [Osmia lignaria lignaria]|uniref:uncharacterized protein LOC117601744 isoform X1 n=1 Tax=Osmia lignaria lignaria TaxID=1437193 RepID=UPI00402B6204
MMLRRDRFFVVLALLCAVAGFVHAIYDPKEATTKRPKRREQVLPWYSSDKDDIDSNEESDPSRSPKWQLDPDDPIPREPFLVDTGTKTWSPWKKNPGSEIEQRTELSSDRQTPTNFEQNTDYPLEYSQFEQQENQRFPSKPSDSHKQEEKWKKQKIPEGKDSQSKIKNDQEFYEGIPPDSTKPRKEEILLAPKPKSIVARYDSKTGIQCPDFDSSGQFVYPPDCKFFVNCWKGRAFVQPCAPGTLFNPDTLECDFPHKVKCYGGEVADFPSNDHLESSGKQEPLSSGGGHGHLKNERLQEPRCPPYLTGMLPHPSNCTKYLQCAHGGTYIRDCGPGTVFNPAISVCDWPRNVKGCEDALIPKEENTTPWHPPEYEDYEYKKPGYNQKSPINQIKCPPGYTGYLPHPETCKKFLQCDHGGTFIMDCGPGTAFNPAISVCDWPYNVPSCNENKPIGTTTNPPWASQSHPGSRPPWMHPGTPSPGLPTYPMSTIAPPETDWESLRPTSRPSWKPSTWTTPKPSGTDWDSLRPTWIPSLKPSTWTTPTPPYSHGRHHGTHGHNDGSLHYADNDEHTHKEHDRWGQSTLPSYPQWHHNHGTNDQSGHHHHHHEHHYYSHNPTYDPNINTETQQPSPPYPQRPSPETPQGNWHPTSGYHHDHHHHHYRPYYHDGSGETDQQTEVPVDSNRGDRREDSASQYPHDHRHHGPYYHDGSGETDQQTQVPFGQRQDPTGRFDYSNTGSNVPGNRRNGQEYTPNRQEYGRTNPGFSHPVPPPGQNIYVDSNYQLPDNESNLNTQVMQNETNWTKPTPTGSRLIPSSWSQLGPGQPQMPSSSNRRWDQGVANEDDKGGNRTNINLNTTDRAVDTKLNLWPLKPNMLEHNKGQHRPGVKGGTYNSSKPLYPSNIYVDINGTRAHFITKEIEVNQGHSKINTYRPNDIPRSNESRKIDQNIYIDSQTPIFDQIPSLALQPPYYTPDNKSSIYRQGHRTPKHYPLNASSGFGDLDGSGSDYHRVAVPSVNLQPPPYPINQSLIFPFFANISRVDIYYPAVPATNLQPPPKPPRLNSTFPIGWQYPILPSTEFQPPPYSPPSRSLHFPNFTSPNINQYPSITTSKRPEQPLTTPVTPSRQYPTVPINNFKPTSGRPDLTDSIDSTTQTNFEDVTVPLKSVSRTGNKVFATMDPNVPTVSIEETTDNPKDFNSDYDYDVDILVDKEIWKPVLVFDNNTQTTTESSVIMKINKKKVDVDLFNIEAAPFENEEPPFPSYYIPPVEPLDHSKKVTIPTPISGQVVRLRGGSGPHDGYVEVQGMNPGWGIVCDSRNSWSLKEAHVVCKQLGYVRGAEMAWQGRNNRNGVPTWIAANTVSCQGDEAKFQSCKFTHEQECRVERDAIGVRCALNRVAHCHKDELPYEGNCYHLADPDSGLNHAEALSYCSQKQSRLIDITSQAENDFISEWLVQQQPEVGSIMTSGVGFTTLNRTLWLWEDSSRAKFRFTKWWPGWMEDKKVPPFVGSRPLCLVMKRKFPCHERPDSICVADYFFWDTEDCASSSKGHSYICKRPYDDIGCIYGKGSQYAGNANVTATGKECLPWSDPKVAYPLTVNVVNREIREKLKTHNYCRNPNPNRESRPWCFTGPGGEKEYCDIPPCGNVGSPKSILTGKCKPKHFECVPGECIPSPWVCDGEEDCTNGADEKSCVSHMDLFQKYSKQKLEGHDVQKWLNTPLKTCALRCKEADFTCRSFAHKTAGNVCLLSDSNVGMTGALKPNKEYDYYEMKERSINCEGMFVCENRKCINQTKVCNGKNDCNDRSDESICTVENLDYDIRLAGSENNHEGRIEVKILGVWGQVCDDGFGMIDADVICKELGFVLGALEVRPGGFYGNLDPPTRFMVDQLRCRGNETTLRECDFDGWGVHNCEPEEAVGVICKTAVDSCQDGHWKCDNSPMCIPTAFICDEVVDCADGSDENSEHCDAPFEIRLVNGSSRLEGRVEVRHHGIWGTVCDDDFSNATAAVICRSLGYGGRAIAKKDGFFGPGEGPIWLDEVYCLGNETQLYRCDHNHWGQHNCNHDEDAGVICTPGDIDDSELYWQTVTDVPETNINDILPSHCGKRLKDFNEDDGFIFEKVVHGSIAPKGTYPWQASIRVRGHSRSNHWCGAVVLSPLHVLTAAHCLQGYNKGTYFVRAGDYNTEIDEGTEVEANIEDYYIHEDFRKGHRMNNDIAVVLLKGRGIPLGKNIMPICLPSENTEYPPGLNCTISGFGSIETGKSAHSKDLRYGWVPLLDQSVCRAEHIYGVGAISDGMVCAGYLEEGIDTCDGDSGGPLACYHNGAFTLYGITSWGQHCGKANKPGVYVRVSHYRRWIDQKIKESLSGR